MKQLQVIGLDEKKSAKLGDKLNELLANYQILIPVQRKRNYLN